jgi:hypothetical protein
MLTLLASVALGAGYSAGVYVVLSHRLLAVVSHTESLEVCVYLSLPVVCYSVVAVTVEVFVMT